MEGITEGTCNLSGELDHDHPNKKVGRSGVVPKELADTRTS